jgi:CRISPR-associated helicase Cas3
VLLRVFPAGKKATETKDALIQKIVEAAIASNAQRTAVFTREVTIADKVADGIRKKLKEQGIAEDHLCKITGRIRGYERECLSKQKAFRAFIEPRDVASTERWFLIGTAAAEVGLDADADAIFCDFAPLPTLLQRLGRLDRRGILSRRHVEGNGDAPTMVIFTTPEQTKADVRAKLTALAGVLKAETKSYSAELMAGTHWSTADKTDKDKTDDDSKEQKPAKNPVKPLVEAATWSVLDPKEGVCKSPNEWLAHDNARIAAGPVVVPPLTNAVLDYFSATTDTRSPNLSPHPFLYGLADDDEGTPLVGVAFRLEVAALRGVLDDDDTEASDVAADVEEIFKRFPPLRAELHQMKLSAVRDWLTSDEGTRNPLVYRAKDKWRAKPAGESASAVATAIGPNGTLILPSSVLMRDPCKELLKDCEQSGGKDTAISDVLDGVSDPQQARYLRTIEPRDGLAGEDGAWRWGFDTQSQMRVEATKPDGFKQKLRKELHIGGKEYIFRYYRPHLVNGQLQYLDDFNGEAGHLTRAKNEAARLAEAIAPGNAFLSTLLTIAAHYHDEGKRFPKWQRAFGWRNGMRELAKLHPDSEKPAPLNGFRHEWESLRRLVEKGATSPTNFSPEDQQLWSDLLLHLVGVHHGRLRPSIMNDGLTPTTEPEKQNPLRLGAAERFAWLQSKLGRWRLAYLEVLLKTADAEGSRVIPEEEEDGN